MYQTEFHRLSMSEAEEAIVEIWKCLEEYNLPTPHMTIDFVDAEKVSIRVDVEDPLWAIVLSRRMSSSAGASPYDALAYRSTSKKRRASKHLRAAQVAPFAAAGLSCRPPKVVSDIAWPVRRR